jgi:hypothetical protein
MHLGERADDFKIPLGIPRPRIRLRQSTLSFRLADPKLGLGPVIVAMQTIHFAVQGFSRSIGILCRFWMSALLCPGYSEIFVTDFQRGICLSGMCDCSSRVTGKPEVETGQSASNRP